MVKILVAEDDEMIRLAYETVLSAAGYHITSTGDGDEAARHLKESSFDLVITDLMMPNQDGIAIANIAREMDNAPKIIVITGGSENISPYAALQLSEDHIASYLVKPVDPKLLLETISKTLELC